jgi:hypothetical protein
MKRTSSALLALVFIIYIGGIQVFYWIRMDNVRAQSATTIKQAINLDNTKEFTFTLNKYNALNWSDKNKEFEDKGTRYDIISINYLNDGQVKIECYNDSKETSVVDAFVGFMDRMFSTRQQSSKEDNNLVSKIYKEYIPVIKPLPSLFSQVLIAIRPGSVLVNASSLMADIWHPPCA